MLSNVLSYIIIIIFLVIIYSASNSDDKICLGTLLVIYIYYYYFYLWSQMFNVYPSKNYKKLKKYKKKLLWINTSVIDVNNPHHKKWAQYILLDSAPNKLGIYISRKNPDKAFVSNQIETFKVMFNHKPSRIYFNKYYDSNVSEFCDKKKIKISTFPFRFISES